MCGGGGGGGGGGEGNAYFLELHNNRYASCKVPSSKFLISQVIFIFPSIVIPKNKRKTKIT